MATVLQWAGGRGKFEFQRLHGMGAGLYEDLIRDSDVRCRIYAPVGGYAELLPYLVRRILENSANAGFVYQLGNLLASYNAPLQTTIAENRGGVEHADFAFAFVVVVGTVAVLLVVLSLVGPERRDVRFGLQ